MFKYIYICKHKKTFFFKKKKAIYTSIDIMLNFLFLISILISFVNCRLYWNSVPKSWGTCNDGSEFGFYSQLNPGQYSSTIIIFLQGGGYCFDEISCGLRWKNQNNLMSSKSFDKNYLGPWGLFNNVIEKADSFYFPYCTSDSWSGNVSSTNLGYSFNGAKLLRNIFQNKLNFSRSLDQRVLFAGGSAGAEGLYPHVDWLDQHLKQNYARSFELVPIFDSGFFLDNKPFKQGDCRTLGTCTEQGGLIRGVPLWHSVVDESCSKKYFGKNLWKCMLGAYAADEIQNSRFVLIQFLFDLAQLGHDGIYHEPSTAAEKKYAALNAKNVTAQLLKVHRAATIFSPSCYQHTMIMRKNWLNITVDGTNVWQAIQQGGRWFDKCFQANCNPTCLIK